MKKRHGAIRLPRIKLTSAAVASCFASHLALANPTGPTVVNGQVNFQQQGNLLQITNSPNSIINWQSFSIGTNEITRFIQQSSSSAVLNRVTTQNPSSILGALQSNGRVLLINPNGIAFGAGAQIDVAGLVASTLRLSDTDFLAGRLRFTDGAGAGSVANQGTINSASGGHVYLVGPAVTNGGVITSPKGEVVLAAGNSVELVNPGSPNLRVEITAPDNQAINLGQIVADSGRVGIYAGLIDQRGTIRADSAVVTEDGRIVLKATKGVNLEAGSVTAASGVKGGNVTLETDNGTIRVAGQIDATGSEAGGAISIAVTGESGGIDLGTGLNAGNAAVRLNGPGHTTSLEADIITAGAAILINDSVELGTPALITLDTTNGGMVPGGANVTITGTVNDDVAGTTGLVLSSGAFGMNTLGSAVGNTAAIASFTASGNITAINGGLINTTGNQTYNGPVTLGGPTTLTATGPTTNISINNSLFGGLNNLTINSGNLLVIAGNVTSGLQTVNVGGGLIVQSGAAGSAHLSSTGGQTINARFIEVTAQGGNTAGIDNSTGGNQVITVAGSGTSPGIDVQSLASGGQASIGNFAPGASQVITVTDADHINVNGMGPSALSNVSAIISAGTGTQTISITGSGANAIKVGSAGAQDGSVINALSQSITAGASGQSGSITIVGPAVNGSGSGLSTNAGAGTQSVSTSGALTITGGGAPAQLSGNPSGIGHNSSGPQTVTAESVTLQGGLSGSRNAVNIRSAGGDQTINASHIAITGGTGTNNFAMIERAAGGSGLQTINVIDGTITLQGGSGSGGNFARIRNDGAGAQTISGSPTITITGGSGGVLDMGNQAQIRAVGSQVITAGPTTLIAGASGFNNLAGIHGPDQDITIHGNLTLTGGGSVSGATSTTDARIGGLAGADPTPTNLVLVVEGNVTMNGGNEPNASPVIGSSFTGGQPTHITMNVDGNLTLGTGTAGLSSARIGSPNVAPSGGDISITAGGNITLDNASVIGTRSVIRTLDSLTLDANDIYVGGSLISRAQTINAAGDFTVAAPNAVNALVTASGPQSITADGALTVQGGAGTGLSAQILGSAGQTINASSIKVTGGSVGNSSFAEIRQTGSGASQAITASNSITITGGASGNGNFARIRNDGLGIQTINANGPLHLTGGAGGEPDFGNFAQIRAAGTQSITAGDTSLAGGGDGFSNFASLISPDQNIIIHGNLTMTGGSSASGPTDGGAARIGATNVTPGAPTNLLLTVDGDVTMTGGSMENAGAVIGSGSLGGQPTHITMNIGGDLTMNPGTAVNSGSRIGSPGAGIAGGNISIDAGGSITMNGAITPGTLGSVIRTLDGVMLDANAIVQGETARIQAGSLVTNTANGTSLTGSNQVASFNATNTTSGDIALNNARPMLTVTGVNQVPFGALTINQVGDLALTGTISSGPQTFNATGNISVVPSSPAIVSASGPQTITSGGRLIVQSSAAGPARLMSSGGQTINAQFVEVIAQDNLAMISNSVSGDQLITTTGMNASGDGLAVRSLGGPGATIQQLVTGGRQVIDVSNANRVILDGINGAALIFDNSGVQTLTIRGSGDNELRLGTAGSLGPSQIVGGGIQTVTAGMPGERGSITIHGKASGSGGNSMILSSSVPGGLQTITTPGTLAIYGGTSIASPSDTGIFANGIDGQQNISAARINLRGGSSGSDNSATINANTATQQITANDGDILLQGGIGGTVNDVLILGAAAQNISATGNVTLASGSGAGNGVRIGSLANRPTLVTLNAGGDVTLASGDFTGTAASIGNSTLGSPQPNFIDVTAGGSVVLSSGSGATVRIGNSVNAPAVEGKISIRAGDTIQLNGVAQATRIRTLGNVDLAAGGAIVEGPNGIVEAGALTTTSGSGASLTGPNQVASFNATNAASGDIALFNSGNLVVMATNSAPGGKVTINNLSGDLSTSGAIAASGGGQADVALVAGGAVNIARPVTASGTGNISLAGGAITVDDTSVTAGGSVTVNGVSLDVKGVSAGAKIRAGNGFDADLSGELRVRSASPGGRLGGWSTISGGDGPVSIKAGSVAIEGGKNLGGFAAITGGPIAIATTGDFGIRGGSGIGAFGWMLSDQDIDLTIGGSLRLNSGTGFGSFARLETIGPSSTINVHFPNRLSGGYFVNGAEGRIAQGLTGFFTGFRPATLGDTLIVTYGQ